jgi:hypothetical protein
MEEKQAPVIKTLTGGRLGVQKGVLPGAPLRTRRVQIPTHRRQAPPGAPTGFVVNDQNAWLRTRIERDILPLFPGSRVVRAKGKKARRVLTGAHTGTELKFGFSWEDRFRFALKRKSRYAPIHKRILDAYIPLIVDARARWGPAVSDVREVIMLRLVARVASGVPVGAEAGGTARRTFRPARESETLLKILSNWAEETYEGKRIAAAFHLGTEPRPYGNIRQLANEIPSRIVSDGVDSWLEMSAGGGIVAHHIRPHAHPGSARERCFPYRYRPMADVTRNVRVKDDDGKRVTRSNGSAYVLNRNGEILVFAGGNLLFAKRRGSWHFFDHDEAINTIRTPGRAPITHRRALYNSCLDASFARCGACVAVVPKSAATRVLKVIHANDYLVKNEKPKARLLRALIANKPFHGLNRHTRRELLGIDGAVVVLSTGKIVTAGAIIGLKVPGSENGGARKAAAIQLSKIGFAVKVSADGKVTGYQKKKEIFSIG